MNPAKTSAKIKERVAAGLKGMKSAPDAFLFLDGFREWTWDLPDIFGIPVFHTTSVVDSRADTVKYDAPFVPIWKEESVISYSERDCFLEGYDECAINQRESQKTHG